MKPPRPGHGTETLPLLSGRSPRLGAGAGIFFCLPLCALLVVGGGCGDAFERAPADPSGTGGAGGSGQGGSGGEGGQGGSGGGTPTACVPSEVSDAVASECGVFVSSSLGDDANDGSPTKPFATVKKALESAAAKRIYVCSESAPLTADVLIERAVEMYGGLGCTKGWVYDAAKPTRIATAAGLIPMRVKGVGGAVRIEDFDLAAADAVEDGGSSVGMFVKSSDDVLLRRVLITAGSGKDGVDAVLEPFTFVAQTSLNGNSAMAGKGGVEKTCECGEGAATLSVGGKGGDDVAGGQAGSTGLPDFGGGTGGLPVDIPQASCFGQKGATSNDVAAQGPGAALRGSLDVAGWHPQPGADGTHGPPGQGGGGGASDADGSGAGGGGACGGCGGEGGPGGRGGGGSIGLLVLAASISVELGTIRSQAAGAGGDGVSGQLGQTEVGDPGIQGIGGCMGGEGAPGGAGGPGGGGAGGVSAPIVSQGTAPVVTGTELLFEAEVAPGGAGAGAGNDGLEGQSGTTVVLGS